MKTNTAATANEDSIVAMVRRIKQEHAAEYGFDVHRIAEAARKAQSKHPELVVSLAENGAEQSHRADADNAGS